MSIPYKYIFGVLIVILAGLLSACKRLVTIPDPVNTLTSNQVFDDEKQATAAMAGVYTQMINGSSAVSTSTNTAFSTFSDGLSTILGGLSSDELLVSQTGSLLNYNTNKIINPTDGGYAESIWQSAYRAIYGCNSVIEGLAASTSAKISDGVKKELTGESKFIRAFSYLYLTSYFGDVPLALTIDFNQTATMARTKQQQVYQQIVNDLKDAQTLLFADSAATMSGRVYPSKWAATALLARTYLYSGDYADAAEQATAVIGNGNIFHLESDLNNVFLTASNEAIWQLKQSNTMSNLGNATPEGMAFQPIPLNTGPVALYLTPQLLNDFETGDQRMASWVAHTDFLSSNVLTRFYYPNKYRSGGSNISIGGPIIEMYVVLRLAECYLIRAEAEANGAGGGLSAAIADLNTIRRRAGLSDLPGSLSQDQAIAAVARERRIELFCEWGHRWLDLKRTGKAHDVLSSIAGKQPWLGDYQLLYPIPQNEIVDDHNLAQNPGY